MLENYNLKRILKKRKRIRKEDDGQILTKRSTSEKIIFGFVFVVFFVYAASLIYPLIYLVVNSFQTPLDYFNNLVSGKPFAIPKEWQFVNYKTAFTGMYAINSLGDKVYMPEMIFNSIWFCGVSMISVVGHAVTGYVFSRYKFPGNRFIHGFVIFTITIPIMGTGGSTFVLYNNLGLYNTPLFLLPTLVSWFGFNFLLMYGFYKNVPWNYAEAVFIDGGGHFTAFFKVMLPQATPMLTTFAILSWIGSWNDYLTPLLYLPDYPTLASGLYRIQSSFTRTGNVPAFFAGLIVSTVPILILFACTSEKIMKNIGIGGLKG